MATIQMGTPSDNVREAPILFETLAATRAWRTVALRTQRQRERGDDSNGDLSDNASVATNRFESLAITRALLRFTPIINYGKRFRKEAAAGGTGIRWSNINYIMEL